MHTVHFRKNGYVKFDGHPHESVKAMAAERAITKRKSDCLDLAASMISSFTREGTTNLYEKKRKERIELREATDLLEVPFYRRQQPNMLAKVEEEMKKVLGYQSGYEVQVSQQPYEAPSKVDMIKRKSGKYNYRVRVCINLKQWVALEKLQAVAVGSLFLLKISKRKSENELYARALEFRHGHRFHAKDVSVRRATDGVWRLHRVL